MKLTTLFVSFMALLSFGIGAFFYVRHRSFVGSARRVEGITLSPSISHDPDGDPVYTTRFEYTVNGENYIALGRSISNIRWFHRPGRTVLVYFRPEKPAAGRLVGWPDHVSYAVPVLLTIYLVAMLIWGRPS